MPHYILLPLLLLLASMMCAATPMEVAKLVAHNDVIYLSPAREGWEGLPLGNGTLGAQGWQNDSGMLFQLNTPLGGVYNGALARMRVRVSPASMISGLKSYHQRLALYDATLTTAMVSPSGTLRTTAFIPADTDALVLHFDDVRTDDREISVEMEAWRPTATSTVAGDQLLITDVLTCLHEPDYRYALAVGADGGAVTADTDGQKILRLRLSAHVCTIWATVAATRDPKVDVAAQAQRQLAELQARGLAKVRASHAAWWAQFWAKSFIALFSADGTADYLANLWYMHIYAMGAGSRGEVPPKFNGGLWLDNYDTREWGPSYWHWNTQETYWPLYAANHLDLLVPYYRMYFGMLPNVERQTKDYFGVEGAQYEETIAFNGGYGSGKGPKMMGDHPRLPTPKSYGNTNMILSSSAEIAMQFWWGYLYTGDETFLRAKAYPLMKSVATFYLNYLEKDAAGHYVIYPSNAHETYLKVHNPTTDLAGIRYLFPALIAASTKLGVDAEQRPIWQELLDHLAPYAIDPQKRNILPYQPQPGEEIKAANAENPDLFPIGVFPLITLGSPDYDLGLRTFANRRFINTYGWTTDSIAAARLGLRDELAKLLPGHAMLYQDHPSGLMDYYGRKPAIHPYLEGSGTFATGMEEMLLQSWGGVMRICPALPQLWNASFKLLAIGGFEVTARAEQGEVVSVSIDSTRGGTLRMMNPYVGEAVVRHQEKVVGKYPAGSLIELNTHAGGTYQILPATPVPLKPAPSYRPNTAPKRLSPTSARWIGKPEATIAGWKPLVEPHAPQPLVVSAITRPAQPEVRVAKLSAPITLDGELSDPAWKDVPTLGPFFQLGHATPVTQQTEVKVAHDADTLYLAITCWEARMAGVLAEYQPADRDGNVYLDDSVEIFLQPSSHMLWHLAFNVLGAQYDARGLTPDTENVRLNLPWKVAVARHSNRWTAEVAIPFSALAPNAPGPETEWGFNICRNEKPLGETSTWAPLSRAAFHLPEEFARLRFPQGQSAPPEIPVDPHLVGCWTGNGLRGVWVHDGSGSGHAAQLFGNVTVADGKIGKGLALNGGYLEVPDAPELRLTTGMSMMAWVYPKAIGAMRLIDKGIAGQDDAYMVDTYPNNNLRVITSRGSMNLDTTTLPLNSWTHVAVTYDGKELRLYLNGILLKEIAATGVLSATPVPLHLGADSGGGSLFNGILDGVMLWNRALTAEEIGKYMQAVP